MLTTTKALSFYHLKPLGRHLLTLFIASSPALAIADSKLHTHQEWGCKANEQGEWVCQQQNKTPSAYPLPKKALVKPSRHLKKKDKASAGKTSASLKPEKEWDWVAKNELDDPSSCKKSCKGRYVEPTADWPEANTEPKDAPLRANSGNTDLKQSVAELGDNVVLTQGYRKLKADKVTFNRDNNELTVDGHILVREPNLMVKAESAQINVETNLGHFNKARFIRHDSGLRGEAKRIARDSSQTLDLKQGSITQCTPNDEFWIIHASNIHINQEEGYGSAKHARLRIKDVPVFYAPYMTFPIDDRRKTGLLAPTISASSDNGFEITTPYYLNLAPNYDATIAPRYIQERGTMLELELRHLSQFGHWTLAGSQLDDDSFVESDTNTINDELPPREKRWAGDVKHQGQVLGLTTRINYTKVSDDEFFGDLSTDSLDIKRTNHLNQLASVGWRNKRWQAEVKAQQYQTIDELLREQYQLMPQITFEHNNLGANFQPEWLLDTEFSNFQHEQSFDDGGSFVTGQRAYSEVGASYPMRWAAGFIVPSAKVRYLDYNLDSFPLGADDSPTVTTPLATLDMGLIFERSTDFSGNSFTQTLEPRLYYFYSDFEEQSGNPDFDTKQLNFSYNQLFRDTRFAGNDRLDDANQVSIGLTSRFIEDSQGREVVTFSLGQTFFLENHRVLLGRPSSTDAKSNSLIASEIQYQPNNQFWLTNSILWDSRRDQLQEGGISFHYQSQNNSLYNLSYRYRRDGARLIQLGSTELDLSQADASIVYPLTERWSVFSRFRYDIEQNRSLDQLAGLQYEDCCWMVRLLYQKGIEDEYINALSNQLVVENDYAFIFEFQLKGLGSLGNKARSLLKESILGYENLDQ